MPKRGEKGFTLIELLIVVAILGVLAAVVIPNVGRFIGRGEDEAADTELANIQAAVLAMMVDLGQSELPGDRVAGNATASMSAFPIAPYVLYGNTISGTTVNYVATDTTKGTYYIDVYGTVSQNSTGYE
ncbi:type IV pilin protein [Chloroflexota bacterium]